VEGFPGPERQEVWRVAERPQEAHQGCAARLPANLLQGFAEGWLLFCFLLHTSVQHAWFHWQLLQSISGLVVGTG